MQVKSPHKTYTTSHEATTDLSRNHQPPTLLLTSVHTEGPLSSTVLHASSKPPSKLSVSLFPTHQYRHNICRQSRREWKSLRHTHSLHELHPMKNLRIPQNPSFITNDRRQEALIPEVASLHSHSRAADKVHKDFRYRAWLQIPDQDPNSVTPTQTRQEDRRVLYAAL